MTVHWTDGQARVKSISPIALQALVNYDWPGNVRELVNVVERAVSFCDSEIIEPEDLADHVREARPRTPRPIVRAGQGVHHSGAGPGGRDDRTPVPAVEAPRPPSELLGGDVTFKDAKERWVSSFERDYIISLLRRHGGNISHAAREADIDRKYFRKLMKKYEIEAAGMADES